MTRFASFDRPPWQRVVEVKRDSGRWIDVLDCGHEVDHEGSWSGTLTDTFTFGRRCVECPPVRMLKKVGGDESPSLRSGGSSYDAFVQPEEPRGESSQPMKAVTSRQGSEATLSCGHVIEAPGAVEGQGIPCPRCTQRVVGAWRASRRVRKPVLLPWKPEES